MRYKLLTNNPEKVIEALETLHPEYKGICFLGKGRLESKNPQEVTFYFDPFH